MNYKVGDSLKIITDMFEGIGVYKGATVLVVQECETEGQWLDRRGVEADALNTFANGKYFELVKEEKVNKKFKEGDKVISIKNTPDIPEGFIGFVTNDPFLCVTGYDYAVESINNPNGSGIVELFREDELELLSVGKKEKFQQLKEEARIIFDGLVDKDHPFNRDDITPQDIAGVSKAEYTGGSSSYYKVDVTNPTTSDAPYQAECNDVIEALGLTFTEGNIFKAIWRIAADRQGKKKKGNNSVYDAEKVVFFAERLLIQEKSKEGK